MAYLLHYAGEKFKIKGQPPHEIVEGFWSPGSVTLDTESHGEVTLVTGPGIPVYVTKAPSNTLHAF